MGTFTIDLTRIINKTKLGIDTVVQKVTLDVFNAVILKTPVDTGRARMNWTASVGGYGSNSVDGVDKSGVNAIDNMTSVVMSTKAGNIVYIVNNLPYILRLEYGYSKQSPNGMVRTTVTEYQSYIKKSAVGF